MRALRGSARTTLFAYSALSKSVSDFGLTTLLVVTIVNKLNRLVSEWKHEPMEKVDELSLGLQLGCASVSALIIVYSRYPRVWNSYGLESLKKNQKKLFENWKKLTYFKRFVLIVGIGFFGGFLSSAGRFMSAALGVEISQKLLQKIPGYNIQSYDSISYAGAVGTVITSFLFDGFNMLAKGSKYLAEPGWFPPLLSGATFLGIFDMVLSAMNRRFYIMHFLDRNNAGLGWQIGLQSLFSLVAIVRSVFTVGSALQQTRQQFI